MRIVKRTVPFVVMGGFCGAALFLIGLVWYPANAETPSPEGIDTSLLLTLDQPVTPAPRTIQIEEDATVDATQTDLAMELNTWTFTRGPGDHGGHYPPPHPTHPPHPPHPHHPPHPPHPHHHTPHR